MCYFVWQAIAKATILICGFNLKFVIFYSSKIFGHKFCPAVLDEAMINFKLLLKPAIGELYLSFPCFIRVE